MKKKLTLRFADLICELLPDNKQDFILLKNEYTTLSTYLTPTYKVKMNSHLGSDFMLKKKEDNTQCVYTYPRTTKKLDENNYIFYGLEAGIEYLALSKNVLFLHASSFVKNGKAYVFCGPSGQGKSTIINAIPHKNVLSDDTTILKKIGNQFWAFTSPFDNKKRPGLRLQKALVHKIFFLKQHHETKWTRLYHVSGLKNVLQNDLFYYYLLGGANKVNINKRGKEDLINKKKSITLQASLKKLYQLAVDLTIFAPLYKLYFTKDLSFLKMI